MDDTTAAQPSEPPDGAESRGSDVVGAPSAASPVPTPGFTNLSAPDPVVASPSESARALAFAAILIGGLLGGLVGFGIGDVLYPDSTWSAVGALAGALTGAVGLGVLANLTLRAMNEWKTATHPESDEQHDSTSSAS
ncbi:MAG: hypothetical protein OES24_06260 [Acidimicrobiia bacterium]|nr:hypothetical protein [Acidimicrobiia bacterium]